MMRAVISTCCLTVAACSGGPFTVRALPDGGVPLAAVDSGMRGATADVVPKLPPTEARAPVKELPESKSCVCPRGSILLSGHCFTDVCTAARGDASTVCNTGWVYYGHALGCAGARCVKEPTC